MSAPRSVFNLIYRLILFGGCLSVLVYLLPKEPEFPYEFEVGEAWRYDDLQSPFQFSIKKSEEELLADREEARNITPYYFRNRQKEEEQGVKLQNTILARWAQSEYSAANQGGFLSSIFSSDRLEEEDSLAFERHVAAGLDLLARVYDQGIIKVEAVHGEFGSDFQINLVDGAEWQLLKIGKIEFSKVSQAYEYCEEKIDGYEDVDASFLLDVISECLVVNISFDQEKTTYEQDLAEEAVLPTNGQVIIDEMIVQKGQVIDEDVYMVLISFKDKYNEQHLGSENYWWITLGQTLLLGVTLLLFFLFLTFFRKGVSSNNKRLLFLVILVVGMAGLTKLAVMMEDVSVYVVPLCLLPIIVRAFTDHRLALFVHLISVFVCSFLVENRFEFAFLQFVAGTFVLVTLANLNKRSQFFGAVFVVFLALTSSYCGLVLIREGNWMDIDWINLAWFGGNAMLSLFAYLFIYVFEKAFGFLSELTLIELSDLNNKLLRRLSNEAPGTFQHSLQVANLAEDAIREVGGNPLLVRVGALYHDIGKMENSAYFIENQSGVNPHDELPYRDSAALIIGHVAKGVEIAKKAGLPDQIIDFIRTHHGTTRTEYFYRMHVKERPEDADENEFRYPGPLPYSKETAVLMMADSCEAASKSLKEYDQKAISNLVDGIITYQMEFDQFNNADITFKDITVIKKMFKKKLMNIYHVRVEYPE